MKNITAELIFIITVIAISIGGFWNIFFGADADPEYYHYLHAIIVFIWLFLLLGQLLLVKRKNFSFHRQLGTAIFLVGPLLIAHLTLLTIHSANNSAMAGRVDDFLVQNVLMTIEVGLIILLGFIMRRNVKLHANFLISSALLFKGIALFFALISFIPQFRIEGPETFYRFGTAAITSTIICSVVGVLFFFKDRRNGWPWLVVVSFFFINMIPNSMIAGSEIHKPLTEFVGSFDQTSAFIASFVGFLILLSFAWKFNTKSNFIRKRSAKAQA